MSIDLTNPLQDGINYLKKWRDRYSTKEYPSKIVLNIFYRQYAMDSIWDMQIANSFEKLANTEVDLLEAFKKIETEYSASAENFTSNNRLINLIKEGVEIGGLNYNSLLPLILKAEKEDNTAIEELEFTYLYWFLANKSTMMWSAYGRIGHNNLDSVTKVTNAIIKINKPFTYKNSLNIFGNLIVSKFMEEKYVPLKPLFMNNYEDDFLSGIQAYQNGNYQNAIYFLEKSMSAVKFAGLTKEIEKETIETGYYNLGNAKKETSDFAGAIECYKKALNSNPSFPAFEKGYGYLQQCCFEINTQESLKTAVEYLNVCTKYFPNNEVAFINKGIALINLNDINNARIAFQSAKALGNEDAQEFINDYC
ncbi:tetratricopeptide repeat protein [Winogradskyella forsetii]|uniref:tetratricopeptide repeat protein n=1 Tax=Winogradskyella forsetii TaxID=2686077 RepID=UPI0015CB0E17|nr:tetratricopeptide repeat protein [Winogradskyella forsetii]